MFRDPLAVLLNPRDALTRLDDDERKSLKNNSLDLNEGVINQALNPNQGSSYCEHPWWVASDVCAALEIGNPSDALKRLDNDERTLVSIEGASNGLPVNAVNEPGLYSLILGSRKPEAKAFKRWITHEVLPAIRKTGSYAVPVVAGDLLRQQHALLGGVLDAGKQSPGVPDTAPFRRCFSDPQTTRTGHQTDPVVRYAANR